MKTTKLINSVRSPEVMTRVSDTKWSFRFTAKNSTVIVFAVIDKKGKSFVVTERNGSTSTHPHFMCAISVVMDAYMAVERANDVEPYLIPKQQGNTFLPFAAVLLVVSLLFVTMNAYKLTESDISHDLRTAKHAAVLMKGTQNIATYIDTGSEGTEWNQAIDNCHYALTMYEELPEGGRYSCKTVK